MIWQFQLEDSDGNKTNIDDPVGWDGMTLILERDRGGKHGVFPIYQANAFTYENEAFRILKEEYDANGIEGEMYLNASYECEGGFSAFQRFEFDFSQYDDSQGSLCRVTIPVEELDDAQLLRNRFEQKVNLDTLISFDGVTTLSPYAGLPTTMTIPSKGILVADHSNNPADQQDLWMGEYFSAGTPTPPAGFGGRNVIYSVPGFTTIISNEVGGYSHPTDALPLTEVYMEGTGASWSPPPPGYAKLPYWINDGVNTWDELFPFESIPPIINYDKSLGQDFGPVTLTLEGNYNKVFTSNSVFGVDTAAIHGYGVFLGILRAFKDPYDTDSWDWLSLGGSDFDVYPVGTPVPVLGADFNFSFTVTLNPGDRIYYFDKVSYRQKTAYFAYSALYITDVEDSYFKLSGITYAADTTAKLYLVNEAFSRIVETITDDRLRVYSDFYGRTDASPYTSASDGCGSRKAITEGLMIRRMEQSLISRPPIFSVSLKDMFDGLNPIDNIGMGIEEDPNRSGYNLLRIEDWRYFYNSDVAIECIGVEDIQRRVLAPDHVATFKFGYSKWEAEEFNGIDEFMTSREYRTELTQANTTFSQTSSFIGSSFAIEITRRKGNVTTEDWRYDNDIFIICLRRNSGILEVQQGDILSPGHIVDPNTVLNFRIRPSAMAFAWLPYILASYRAAGLSSKIIFTDGTGNVYAEGEIDDVCAIEGGVISEKQELIPNDMATPSNGLPFWFNESVTFQFPMTVPEWLNIKANSKKRIYYENDYTNGYGWIDRIEYKPEDGMATFTLIPSR